METGYSPKFLNEEQIVAELAQLGINYLSRMPTISTPTPRPITELLADLINQPSSRVRTAMIALFILHPEFSKSVSTALAMVHPKNQGSLKCFYTAAVILQRIYAQPLMTKQGSKFQWLPSYFEEELNISNNIHPEDSLKDLGQKQQKLTGKNINWTGTYKNVLAKLHIE